MTAPMPPSAAQIKAFTPSKYQQAIFDHMQAMSAGKVANHFLVVEAVAGSGKTTTITKAAFQYIDPKQTILFCTFIKDLSLEIEKKVKPLSNATVLNIHRVGRAALKTHFNANPNVDDGKQKKWYLTNRYISEHHPDLITYRNTDTGRISVTDEGRIVKLAIVDLYISARLTLTDPNDRAAVIAMAQHFEIEYDDRSIAALPVIMAWGEQEAIENHMIDFDDMLYLTVKWDLPVPQYDWVMVDEGQDLSRCQLELAMKCRKDRGNMVIVGDRNQAIMGFAKADNRSLENIIERTQATVLPLSICYRCPTSVIEKAREVIPHIEAREGAPIGEINVIPEDQLYKHAQPGDMIICRLKAPLVSQCIDFIKRGRAAKVKGRDIGRELSTIVDKIAKRENFTYDMFLEHLWNYRRQQVTMMQQKDMDEIAIESFNDRCDAVAACYESYVEVTENTDGLNARINELFDDEINTPILLSTIHKAKGLEADHVFILAPHKLPLQCGGWQQIQEWNLLYVAVTRSQLILTSVGGPLTPGPHAQNGPFTPQSPETSTPTADVPNQPILTGISRPASDLRTLEQELDRVAFKHHGDEPDFDIDALRRGDGPNEYPETQAEELDRVMRNTLAELKLQEREAEQIANAAALSAMQAEQMGLDPDKHGINPANAVEAYHQGAFDEDDDETIAAEAASDAQQDPPMLSKKDRERAELKRLFERKPETKRQREQKAIDSARAQFPELPEDEAINAATQKRVQDAQKGTQGRRGPKHDVNPAGNSGGIKPREMVTQQRMFEATEEPKTDDALNTLQNPPELTNPVTESLDSIRSAIDNIDNAEFRQDAIEALEVLRQIFG